MKGECNLQNFAEDRFQMSHACLFFYNMWIDCFYTKQKLSLIKNGRDCQI
uniref:Uncharacterized protein n=1 Tax=uncultured marine bacterium 106 TaxID=257383 RepID=Q6SI12_9BACT|nr:hypothetical protein MBMO_EBAC750-01B07.1 [uncultured marine bacterium 106]